MQSTAFTAVKEVLVDQTASSGSAAPVVKMWPLWKACRKMGSGSPYGTWIAKSQELQNIVPLLKIRDIGNEALQAKFPLSVQRMQLQHSQSFLALSPFCCVILTASRAAPGLRYLRTGGPDCRSGCVEPLQPEAGVAGGHIRITGAMAGYSTAPMIPYQLIASAAGESGAHGPSSS